MSILISPKDLHGLDIGRTIGGIAWPADKSGYAVVVGEERMTRKGGNVRHCHVLAEVEQWKKGELIRQCVELQGLYNTMGFYGRRTQANMNFLYEWNADARKRRLEQLDFNPAPMSETGAIGYHIDVLLQRLDQTKKSLYLNGGDVALKLDIPHEEYADSTDSKFPAIAALGYAVATLDTYEPPDEESEDDASSYATGRSWATGY